MIKNTSVKECEKIKKKHKFIWKKDVKSGPVTESLMPVRAPFSWMGVVRLPLSQASRLDELIVAMPLASTNLRRSHRSQTHVTALKLALSRTVSRWQCKTCSSSHGRRHARLHCGLCRGRGTASALVKP